MCAKFQDIQRYYLILLKNKKRLLLSVHDYLIVIFFFNFIKYLLDEEKDTKQIRTCLYVHVDIKHKTAIYKS